MRHFHPDQAAAASVQQAPRAVAEPPLGRARAMAARPAASFASGNPHPALPQVNRLELLLSIASFAAALGAMVAGIFGMNLRRWGRFEGRAPYMPCRAAVARTCHSSLQPESTGRLACGVRRADHSVHVATNHPSLLPVVQHAGNERDWLLGDHCPHHPGIVLGEGGQQSTAGRAWPGSGGQDFGWLGILGRRIRISLEVAGAARPARAACARWAQAFRHGTPRE